MFRRPGQPHRRLQTPGQARLSPCSRPPRQLADSSSVPRHRPLASVARALPSPCRRHSRRRRSRSGSGSRQRAACRASARLRRSTTSSDAGCTRSQAGSRPAPPARRCARQWRARSGRGGRGGPTSRPRYRRRWHPRSRGARPRATPGRPGRTHRRTTGNSCSSSWPASQPRAPAPSSDERAAQGLRKTRRED